MRQTKTWEEISGKPARMLTTRDGEPFMLMPAAWGTWAKWQERRRPRPAAANDNRPARRRKNRRNKPVLHDITKADPEGGYAVWAYGQQAEAPVDVFGDDNACFDGEEAPENPIEFHPERLHKVKPSVDEMLADLCRVRVVSERGPRGWVVTYRHAGPSTPPRHMGEDIIGLGDLRFNYHPKARRPPCGGLMVSYRDRNGVERHPFYDTSELRGAEPHNRPRRPTSAPAIAKLPPDRIEVSTENARILEMILAGRRKFQIGLELGYSRDYADRGAQQHIDAAVAEVKAKFPAPPRKKNNDNQPQKLAA